MAVTPLSKQKKKREDEYLDDLEVPMRLTTFMYQRPCTCMAITFAVALLISALQFTTQKVVINDIGNFYARDEPYAVENDAVELLVIPEDIKTEAFDQQSVPYGGLLVLYLPAQDKVDVLTEEVMLAMDRFERQLTQRAGYSDVCLRQSNSTTCSDQRSLTQVLIPGMSERDANGALTFPDFAAWRAWVKADLSPTGAQITRNSVDKDFPSKSDVAGIARANFAFGRPLAGFTNPWQRKECDKSKLAEDEECPDAENAAGKTQRDLASAVIRPLSAEFTSFNETNGNVMRTFWLGSHITDLEVSETVNRDISLLMSSILVVGVFMLLHLHSLFLTVMAMFHILLSFPVAWFFYSVLFGYEVMTQMNLMVLFVVLAVGCDDVFVSVDSWRQAVVERPHLEDKPLSRAAFSYRRSFGAMLVTSVTTAVAFYTSLMSVVPTTRVLGVLAGTVVVVNFIMVVTWFPAVMFWHTKMGLHEGWCCKCKTAPAKEPSPDAADVEAGAAVAGGDAPAPAAAKLARQSSDQALEGDAKHKLRRKELFYRNTLYPTIVKYKYPLIVFCTVITCVAIGLSTQIQPLQNTDEDFFDNTHPFQFAQSQNGARFPQTENAPQSYMFWGVAGVQRGSYDINDKENLGFVVYDTVNFHPTVAAVEKLTDVCVEARKPDWGDIILDAQVLCWPEQFRRYVEHQAPNTKAYAGAWNLVTDANLAGAVNDFLNDEGGPYGGKQWRNVTAKSNYIGYVGFKDGDIIWWKLGFNRTLRRGVDLRVMEASLARWEQFETVANNIMGNGNNDGFQIAPYAWRHVEFSHSLVTAAVSGCAVALAVALLMLVLSTRNLVLSALSMLTITINVLCTVAVLAAMGWDIGLIESISLQLVVGLSVDYAVHLSVAYREAIVDESNKTPEEVRLERVRFAMTHIGVSVFGGAVTTLFSVFPLFFAAMIFMSRFGKILVASTVISFSMSHMLLLPLCLVLGPTHGRGDFSFMSLCRKQNGKEANKASAGTPVSEVEMPSAGSSPVTT